MKKLVKVLVALVLILALVGCITTTEQRGNNLDGASSIIKGVSTKTEVFSILGEPNQEVTLDDGTQVCTWVTVKEKHDIIWGALISKGIDSTSQERQNSLVGREVRQVSVTFSSTGVVVSISTSKTGKI
ncbi:MAG: hypothetical protein WC694_00775 [Candidatus Paceibacterota bacterium]|jgi:outer membrane protein assembly factor BamE (lipoprotein component of BamABCDE complex)